jgi:hypothetical protein
MALLFANTLGLPQPTTQQPWPMQPVWIAFEKAAIDAADIKVVQRDLILLTSNESAV